MDLFKSSVFDARVSSLLSEWPVPGLAIAVVQDHNIASKAFGQANLEYGTPITTDTLFDIASSSKALTAASVGLLVEDNDAYPQVQWNSTMSSLLPDDFVLSDNGYTEIVTVEDILSHRVGVPRHDFSYLGIYAERPDTPRSVTRNLRNLEIVAPIRTKFLYSNIMFTVASFLVEQMSKLTFAEYLRKHFFDPLGMNSTHLQPAAAIDAGLQDRIATPYLWKEDTETYAPMKLMQVPESQGAGSIFTSVNDHIKWIKTIMNQEPPISPEVYRGLMKPRIISDYDDYLENRPRYTSPELYAAGWSQIYYRGYEIVYHNGYASGFSSLQFFLPEFKFGGIAIGNSVWANPVGTRLCLELAFDVFNVTPTQFPEWGALPDWKWFQKERKKSEEEEAKKLRQELCPGISEAEPQRKPLSEYTGRYWNGGYHGMNVVIHNGKLFINATDRSNAYTYTFEHLCKQTKYIVRAWDYYEGGEDEMAAEFRFEGSKVIKMGLRLDDEVDHPIWFDKEDSGIWTNDTFALFNGGTTGQIILLHGSDLFMDTTTTFDARSPAPTP